MVLVSHDRMNEIKAEALDQLLDLMERGVTIVPPRELAKKVNMWIEGKVQGDCE